MTLAQARVRRARTIQLLSTLASIPEPTGCRAHVFPTAYLRYLLLSLLAPHYCSTEQKAYAASTWHGGVVQVNTLEHLKHKPMHTLPRYLHNATPQCSTAQPNINKVPKGCMYVLGRESSSTHPRRRA